MADRRTLQEEIVKQCTDHFAREQRYWQRLIEKRRSVAEEEIVAKEQILNAIFQVGAVAALKTDSNEIRENLMWEYRDLQLTIKDYKELVP